MSKKKCARCSQTLVITELVVSGTHCNGLHEVQLPRGVIATTTLNAKEAR